MKQIWYHENKNGTISFYKEIAIGSNPLTKNGLHLHTGTYTYRKALFAYPKFIYKWIKIPCAE